MTEIKVTKSIAAEQIHKMQKNLETLAFCPVLSLSHGTTVAGNSAGIRTATDLVSAVSGFHDEALRSIQFIGDIADALHDADIQSARQ